MPPNPPSQNPSDVNRNFILAAQQVFEDCQTLEELEAVGERLKNDKIATRAEKRLLRQHYAKMRQYLHELEQYEHDQQGTGVL